MKQSWDEIERLAKKTGHVLIATAGADGLPHLAVAAGLRLDPGRAVVTDWFCPGTVQNLGQNRRVTLTIWDASRDDGFQLVGEVEQIRDRAVMDGYDPAVEYTPPMPQVQRELVIRVDHVLRFAMQTHTDKEEHVGELVAGGQP